MGNLRFFILPSPDGEMLDALHGLWEDLGATPLASWQVTLVDGSGQPATGSGKTLGTDATLSFLHASREVVFRAFQITIPDMVREGSPAIPIGLTLNVNRVTAAEFQGLNEISASIRDDLATAEAARLTVAIHRAFRPFEVSRDIDRALGPELAEFYRRREEALVHLERLSQRLIGQNVEYRKQVDDDALQHRKSMEFHAETARKEMLAEQQRLSQALTKREEILAAMRRDLDDRSSRHARRDIHKGLKQMLAARNASFSLSKATANKRLPIHVLFVLWILTSGALLSRSLYLAGQSAASNSASTLAEAAALAVSLIGATAFYIRWNDVWAREHANEEFKMRRLDIDVDRASWVVEVALEFNEEKGSPLPPELLDRLSANLFADSARFERARHPVEDIASLLFGASASAKVALPGGSELSLDRRGIKRLRRSAQAAAEDLPDQAE